MAVIAFRAPIDVSRVRVGTTYGEAGGDLAKNSAPPTSGPPASAPPTSPPKSDEPLLMQTAVTVGGNAFPLEVSIATAAGGVVGLFFGGWFWGALGAVGINLAGRLGASTYCKHNPDKGGPSGDDGYGKCGRGRK